MLKFKSMEENEENTDQEYEECLSKIPFFEGHILLKEKYVYEEEIGKGAYGRVMCGYREKDHCSVAIKVIPNHLVSEWYNSKTLKRKIPLEVLLLALTRQIDGVVSIIEYYEDPVNMDWYLVMERHVKTVDLFEYMTTIRYLQENLACSILYQLLIIIIDCHVLGVVHRDIKEENILIDVNSKKIWLIDFGSGCLMRDDRHTTYNGTIAYSPPEWFRNHCYRGCQLESWTLGIVLYSLLCGNVPFEDEEEILAGIVRFPRKLSKFCVDFILRCLETNPETRIQPLEMISHLWVTSNLNYCESGHSSFDSAIVEAPASRKCSCSCLESVMICHNKDHRHDNESVIETVVYDQNCIKDIEPEWQFKVISKSVTPDIESNQYHFPAMSIEEILKPPFHTIPSRDNFVNQTELQMDNGYNEDIDDNFDEDSLINSNEVLF